MWKKHLEVNVRRETHFYGQSGADLPLKTFIERLTVGFSSNLRAYVGCKTEVCELFSIIVVTGKMFGKWTLPLVLLISIVAVLFDNSQAYPDCPDCGICQQRYLPVCGGDGQTYHNACHLGCEKQCRKPGLKIVHDGECGNDQLIYKYH